MRIRGLGLVLALFCFNACGDDGDDGGGTGGAGTGGTGGSATGSTGGSGGMAGSDAGTDGSAGTGGGGTDGGGTDGGGTGGGSTDGGKPDSGKPDGGPSKCTYDADCKLFSSYCSTAPCQCIVLQPGEADPKCNGTQVSCLKDPCAGKGVVCQGGTCKLT